MQQWKTLIRQNSGLLILLVSGLLVPLITNLIGSWLEATFGETRTQLIQLVAILVAAAVALWVLALALQRWPAPVALVPRDARPEHMPGLVVLVGRGRPGETFDPQRQAAARAIEYHLGDDDAGNAGDGAALKVCWLIASSGAEGSVLAARTIRQEYESRCKIYIREVGNAFSVQDTYDVVQRIYNEETFADEHRELGLMPEWVISDFTSGTAPMTAGMVLACGRYRPMQYTTGYKEGIASMPLLVRFKPTPRRRKGGRPCFFPGY